MTESTSRVVLVPIKAFRSAKSRLRDVLDDDDVERLARHWAKGVLEALAPRLTFVVCNDDDVADFAVRHGASVLRTTSGSLNGDVTEAYKQMDRFDQVIIVHSDLHNPEGLGTYQPGPGVTIITDHHHTGTNVLALPAGLDFRFSYGPDSASRHHHEAERLAQPLTIITDSPWRFDIDEPDDLEKSPDSI